MIDFEQFKCLLLVDQRPTSGFSNLIKLIVTWPLRSIESKQIPDPPRDVMLICDHDYERDADSISVTWDAPVNARGTILSYNITLHTRAQYRNDNGQTVEEKASKVEIIDIKSNTFGYQTDVLPNTEFSVQMCTINRSGCGPLTNITVNTQCKSPSNAKRNRRATSTRVTSMVTAFIGKAISAATVRRRLHMNGLYARVPRVCVPLSIQSRGV
ncbi:tyrosine-protein phosphatase 69D [Trichonephila clavipes]|nr:tyrosine-protein phosphatase 69D [Trichonephila clavipes]